MKPIGDQIDALLAEFDLNDSDSNRRHVRYLITAYSESVARERLREARNADEIADYLAGYVTADQVVGDRAREVIAEVDEFLRDAH